MSSSERAPLKILLLTHSFDPEISPPQRRWKAFTKVFANHGHAVSVVAPSARQQLVPAEGDPSIRVLRYPSFGRPRHLVTKALRSIVQALSSVPVCLKAGPQDVVIATIPALSTLAAGYVASRLLRARFVVDLRDSWPNLLFDSHVLHSQRLEPVVSRVILFLMRRADLVAAVTHGLGRVASAQGMKNVAVMRNGVELANYAGPVPRADAGNRKLRVLYLGNLGLSQGLESLVLAAAELKDVASVRIVGTGASGPQLRRLACDAGAPVEFCEPVHGEQVLAHYAWADTCVVSLRPDWPSFEHTIPSKLYELLALDKHITGLVRGEAAKIIDEADGGEVIGQDVPSLVRHLRQLACDPERLRSAGGGPQWVLAHAALDRLGEDYLEQLYALERVDH